MNYFSIQAGTNITIAHNLLGVIISSSGGGSVSFTAVTITVPFGRQSQIINVVDAAISLASKILVQWGMIAQTDENTPDMDDVIFSPTALAGSMDILVSSLNQNVGGSYKIMYLLG